MEPFVGQIVAVGYARGAPQGWALCQGQQMNIQQNTALYALIGVVFGGNGTSNFNLPDLRGRMMVGTGTPQGSTQNFQLGVTGGQMQTTLTASQVPVPPHIHPGTLSSSTAQGPASLNISGNYSNAVTVTGAMQAANTGATQDVPQSGWTLGDVGPGTTLKIYTPANPATAVPLATITSTGEVSGTLSGQATGNVSLPVSGTITVGPNPGSSPSVPISTMSPFVALNITIAIEGLFPSFD